MSANFTKVWLHRQLLLSCISVWSLVYAFIIVAIEATNVLVFLLLLLGPLGTYYLLIAFALPSADPSVVKEILGVDVALQDEKVTQMIDMILKDQLPLDSSDCNLVVKVIAHRFAGIDAPENTLPALEACYEKGCIAVEFDVALTADKVAVVFHDSTLDRLANMSQEIAQIKWQQLSTIDISVNHPFHERFAGTKIALLEDVLNKCIQYDLRMVIDIKDSSNHMVDTICDAFKKRPILYKRAIVTSFNPLVIYNIRHRLKGVAGAMSWRPRYMSARSYSAARSPGAAYYQSTPAHCLARVADEVSTWLFNNVYFYVLGLSAVFLHKNFVTPAKLERTCHRLLKYLEVKFDKYFQAYHLMPNVMSSKYCID